MGTCSALLEGCATGIWRNISSRKGWSREILPRASVVAAWQIQPGAGAQPCQPWEEEQQRCSEPTDPHEKVRGVTRAGHRVQQVATLPVRVASSAAAGSVLAPPQPGRARRAGGWRWAGHSLRLPTLHRAAWPQLGKMEPRPNSSGFALHTAEILLGFIYMQIPRMQRQAGK